MRLVSMVTTLLLMATVLAAAQSVRTINTADRNKEVKETLALDYSMPDYSTSKIDEKMMGPRPAMILESICNNYKQHIYIGQLSTIQSRQVEGLNYGRIKKMKLENVIKKGNELIIRFNTELESNSLNLKKSQLEFNFVDGVSEDTATNDFFSTICRYLKD